MGRLTPAGPWFPPAKGLVLWGFILLSAVLAAEVRTLEFGRRDDWQTATFEGVELVDEGFTRISPMSEEWVADEDTDLLLHFNQPQQWDMSGHHRILSPYRLSQVSTQGSGALFLSGNDALVLRPSADSFLGGGRGGGSFSIQFWFKPSYSADGEFLFEWDGLLLSQGLDTSQRVSAYFVNQRLVWQLTNLFLHPDQLRSEFLLRSDPLIPGRWYNHHLYYDAERHRLELLIDNQVVDVQHSRTGKTMTGEPLTLLMSNPYRYPFVVGKHYHGYIDEFLLRLRPPRRFYLRQPVYRSMSSAVIGPLDLGTNQSQLLNVDATYLEPGHSRVLFYYQLMNDLNEDNLPHPLDPAVRKVGDFDQSGWQRLNPARDASPQNTGRFLLLKVVFLGDVGNLERPWVSRLTLKYHRPALLPAPGGLQIEQQDAQTVKVSWRPIADQRVAGYRIFLGLRSNMYLQPGYPLDVGEKASYLLQGLDVSQQYYLTVAAYDNSVPSELGRYAPEQTFRLLPHFVD